MLKMNFNKLENLEKTYIFLDIYHLLKLNQDDIRYEQPTEIREKL